MARLLTIVVAIVGFGATIWNTINVEKKGAVLEETNAIVSSVRQDIETRELNYRLAVQEFNFSTLHAADAYDLDSNHKLLAASVAPGTTMLRKKKGEGEGEGRAGTSVLDRAREKFDDRKRSKRTRASGGAVSVEPADRRQSRESIFAQLSKPERAPEPAPAEGRGATRTPPAAGRAKMSAKLRTAMAPVRERIAEVRPHVTTPETKHKVAMIRGFQIENLSRWRQYMNVANTGDAMTEETVGDWEGLVAGALIEADDAAIRDFTAACGACIENWQQSRDEALEALQMEADKQAALEKEISRGKSIYMGLMLVVLVLVTLKDVFAKSDG